MNPTDQPAPTRRSPTRPTPSPTHPPTAPRQNIRPAAPSRINAPLCRGSVGHAGGAGHRRYWPMTRSPPAGRSCAT
jgi:hypothetical protein